MYSIKNPLTLYVSQSVMVVKTPVPSYIRRLKPPLSKQASLPPSFTFRPPSDEPPCEQESGQGQLLYALKNNLK